MKRIYKYELNEQGVQTLKMPKGAEVISAIEQNNKVIVYAIVDITKENEEREFSVIGTGWNIPDELLESNKFIGTVKVGIFVWHVFFKV